MHPASEARRTGPRRRAALLLALLVAMTGLLAMAGPAVAQQDTVVDPIVTNDTGEGDTVVPAPFAGEEPGPDTPVVVDPVDPIPDVRVGFEEQDDGLTRTVGIVLIVALSSMAPAILLLMTSFTRFIVVLGLTKNALALQTVPPSQVLIGLALFLTSFVMAPVFSQMNEEAVQPFLAGEMDQGEAIEVAFVPLKAFMLDQVRDEDLELFINLSTEEPPAAREEVAATTLIPAFIISELRTGFIIGFVIFVPFLLIDLVVAAVLMSMGMVMVPPVFISLPLKLLLFVLVDGWVLMIGSLVQSVNGVGLS